MISNVGTIDRVARFVIGLALLAFAVGLIAPNSGWNWLGWICVLPVVSAIFGTCPAYSVFGCSTK